MRVAYVITRSDVIGGAHVHVRDLCRALIHLGHWTIVLVGGEGPFTEQLRRMGIPYQPLKWLGRPIHPFRDLAALLELCTVLSRIRPHLVSAHSSKAGFLGRLAARLLGIPAVFTVHGWAFTEGVPNSERMAYALAERLAGEWADRVITVSEYDYRLALRYRVVPPKKLVTVHNGVPDVPESLRAQPQREPARLIMVARFEPQKDHATLLRALAKLQSMRWQLDLVGDGPLVEAVRRQAASLGIASRVAFWGARNDIPELLAKSQVFVLTSNWEGLPLTILEAMRAGLPVIASDVGGVREAVVDGETGFLVPRRGVEALHTRLQSLLANPELRLTMGTKGRIRYESHFTFNYMLARTLAVYHEVVNRRVDHGT